MHLEMALNDFQEVNSKIAHLVGLMQHLAFFEFIRNVRRRVQGRTMRPILVKSVSYARLSWQC
jgi:hypothetical protein